MKQTILSIFSVLLLAGCASHEQEAAKTPEKKEAPAYKLAVVEKAAVTELIKLPAQFAAWQEVSIFPKVNGYVKNVLVDIGSKVRKGTLLMVLEAPELEQAVLQARERYTRARADLAIDRERYQRLLEAAHTPGAISPLDLSTVHAKIEADSALANAEKANWQAQQSLQDYLRVTAPFDGVITERNVHPGALVSAAAKERPMLELKQVDHLRLQVDLPEAVSAGLSEKDTVSFITSADPGKTMTGKITRQSNNISAQLRTERVELDVMNPDGRLAPGMFAQVIFHNNGTKDALSVPRTALVISTERKYVLVKNGEHITKVDVRSGNEANGRVEIFGDIHAGDTVIANANDEIKEVK